MINFSKPIIIILIVLVLILLALLFFKSGGPKQPTPRLSPPASVQIIIPPTTQVIPTLSPNQGQGVDPKADPVQKSTQEIAKLGPHLPYETTLTLSTGLKVSVVIPPQKYQNNPWTLTVQIFGINYNSSPDQPDYDQMRISFKEAASKIFDWIRSQGADPSKIYISWGDKAYIQENAERWLQGQ